MKKQIKKVFLLLTALLLVFWLGSVVKCEILTLLHGQEFDQLWKGTALADPEYWKVLEYHADHAGVYYVGPDDQGGTVLYFVRDGENWVLDGWGPYWSKYGSADDIVWPYIR